MNADIDDLRSHFLFDLAHLCGIDGPAVNQLFCSDFFNYCAAIEEYHKQLERREAAQAAAGAA